MSRGGDIAEKKEVLLISEGNFCFSARNSDISLHDLYIVARDLDISPRGFCIVAAYFHISLCKSDIVVCDSDIVAAKLDIVTCDLHIVVCSLDIVAVWMILGMCWRVEALLYPDFEIHSEHIEERGSRFIIKITFSSVPHRPL